MKIVIDILESAYETCKALKDVENEQGTFTDLMIDAIGNGTPLPKGHGRLIDADEIQFENTEFDTYEDYCIAFDAINKAETVLEADKE